MRSPNLLFGLLIMLGACAISFGAGYMIAKNERPAPAPRIETAAVDPTPTATPEKPQRDPAPTPDKQEPAPQPAKPEDSPEITPAASDPTKVDASKPAPAPKPLPTVPAAEDENAAKLNELKERLKRIENGEIDPEDVFNASKEAFSAIIRGSVVDGNGIGVPGASVHGTYGETVGQNTRFVRVMMTGDSELGQVLATTDGSGHFQIDVSREVAKGASVIASLTARAQGHADSTTASVTVAAGETKEGMTLKLRQPGSVSGRVVDQSGTGIAGVTVALSAGNTMGMEMRIEIPGQGGGHSAITDGAGEYRVENVPEGRYSMRIEAAGWAQVSGPSHVEAAAGKDTRAAADFVVKASSSVKVQLRGPDGTPLRTWVNIELQDGSGRTVWKRGVRSNAQGLAAMNEPPAGSYTAVVTVPGYVPEKVQATIVEGSVCDLGVVTLQLATTGD